MRTEIDNYVISDGDGGVDDFIHLYAALVEMPDGRLAVELEAMGTPMSSRDLHSLISVLSHWDSRVATRDASIHSSQYSLDI